MKRILLPLLTLAVVLSATFLPRQLSLFQDRKLQGTVQTEALVTENDLPSQPPTLPERMELLSRWMTAEDVASSSADLLADLSYEAWEAVIWQELDTLQNSGLLPADIFPTDLTNMSCHRMYLRRQLMGADYILLDSYEKSEQRHMWAVLDEETKQLLWLELGSPAMETQYQYLSPLEIGTFFLDRLEVGAEMKNWGYFDARFSIPGAEVEYAVSIDTYYLQIYPVIPEEGSETFSSAK